jgi:asparagine synthase (glutamine-hydrolysing)
MCGIAGFVWQSPNEASLELLTRFDGRLHHRGPDDSGYLLWDGRGEPWRGHQLPNRYEARVGFLHRRLSIIDLTPGGWQPMASADGSADIVYNGEIYNYLELRNELEKLGHRFRSRSDTEVLLTAWQQWGRASLTRLVGMFAFAILDRRARRLVLARDCFGIKPLYFARFRGGFAFASEIKALLEHPRVSRRAAAGTIGIYLRTGVVDLGSETFFADVAQLPAAHLLTLDLDAPEHPQLERYWDLPSDGPADIGENEAAERLRTLFLESVRLHLRSDVPVGAALSGGIDSSSIVAAMRRLEPAAEIHSFTYAADDAVLGEEHWADLAASAAQTRTHKTRADAADLRRDLDALIAGQDQPFGSTSIYAQYRVFALARDNGIKVMLDGQGADEMFAGYRPYLAARAVSLLREGAVCEAWSLLRNAAQLPGETLGRSLVRIAAGLAPSSAISFALALRGRARGRAPWLDESWFAARGAGLPDIVTGGGRRTLREALAATFAATSLPALLRYEDRNSMLHSVESRVPFLTPALVEFAFRLPERFHIAPDGTSKSLFRRAMRGIVPDAILGRRDKIGFQTPELEWLRQLRPWLEEVLAPPSAEAVPMLRPAAMRAELDAVLAGRARFDWRVWRWVNLVRWSQLYAVRYD